MKKLGKKLRKLEKPKTESGILAKFSFFGKLYLALFLLAVGLLAQYVLVLSCFFEYRNGTAQIALSRKANDEAIKGLRELVRDLFEKVNTGRSSVALFDTISQIDRNLNRFRDLDENISQKPINKIDAIIKRYGEIDTFLTAKEKQAVRNLYRQYTKAVNELESDLEKVYRRDNHENFLIILIKLVIILLILVLEIIVCKGLVKRAIRSVNIPASQMIKFLNEANGDLQVKLQDFTSEGLGATGLALNEAISIWWTSAVEFKNASNKLNYLIEDLSSGFNRTFLLEVQLQEVYREIESSLRVQQQMGCKADKEIEMISSDLSGLQYLPRKVSGISQGLNSLLTVNKEYLSGIDGQQNEIGSEYRDIIVFLKDLATTSKRVDQIMKELGEIQEESEMLAFNSAISAARAGAEGQGFSVVAKEIANLVERSKSASNRLSVLIGRIQTQTEQVVSLIPENDFIENGKLSIDQIINSICSDLNATAFKCLAELRKMQQVVETIYTKNNETFEEINIVSDLPQAETDALFQIKNNIERYLESVKHTEEITEKIHDTVNSLQTATNSLLSRNV